MKILKVLLLAVAFAALSATSAWADGAPDPTVKVQQGGGSTPTTDGGSASDPIFVTDASGTTDWLLNSPAVTANGTLFIEVVPYTGEDLATWYAEIWNCEVDPPTTTACGIIQLQGLANSTLGDTPLLPGVGLEFEFFGPFTPGEDVSISVPEPSTLLLLLAGIAIAVVFVNLRKRQAILAQ